MGWSVSMMPKVSPLTPPRVAKPVRFAAQPPEPLYSHMPAQFILANSTNAQGEARMGMLLDMIDIAGGLVASRFCKGRPLVTRSLDRMEFGEPARKFEYLTSHANITYTGGRSMEVALTLDAHNYKTPEYRRHTVAKGYLTYTLFDKNKKMIPEMTPFPNKMVLDNFIAAENRRQNRFYEKTALKKLGTPDQFYITNKEHAAQVSYQATEKDANIHGIVFGGTSMDLIYQAAEKAATGWLKAPAKPVRQDRMNFDKPGKIGNTLTAKALVTRVFDQKQMEVQVELYSQKPQAVSWKDWVPFYPKPVVPPAVPIATSLFLFEAKDGKTPVPQFNPKTPVQKLRWEAADIRRHYRDADEKPNSLTR